MASSVWKGYISFGLVSVPVRLFAAARESHVSFNQIHSECGSRIKQQIVCPRCERPVERNELSKGYEVDKDTYVTVTNEDLKALDSANSDVMGIEQFVRLSDVDPLYFQTSYYTAAEEPGRKAYSLLFRSMKQMGLAAIARVTMHSREQVVLIRPYDKGLVLHTLYFASEVREVAEYGRDTEAQVVPQEVALAEQFIQQLTMPFDAEKYKDTYRERVLEMIEKKREGSAPVVAGPARKLAPVIDLMEALKKSLATQGSRPAAQQAKREAAAPRETAPRKKPVQMEKQSRASGKSRTSKTG
jgi:DNA end-binding protein Ku